MADVNQGYPAQAVYTQVAQIFLTGNGVTYINGKYAVTLHLNPVNGQNTVVVIPWWYDSQGNVAAQSFNFEWVSYNDAPTSANAGDVQVGYPAPATTLGNIASVTPTYGDPVTVLAHAVGQAIIECWVLADYDDQDSYKRDGKGVYSQLLVTVLP